MQVTFKLLVLCWIFGTLLRISSCKDCRFGLKKALVVVHVLFAHLVHYKFCVLSSTVAGKSLSVFIFTCCNVSGK
jgi:hypothetical protein